MQSVQWAQSGGNFLPLRGLLAAMRPVWWRQSLCHFPRWSSPAWGQRACTHVLTRRGPRDTTSCGTPPCKPQLTANSAVSPLCPPVSRPLSPLCPSLLPPCPLCVSATSRKLGSHRFPLAPHASVVPVLGSPLSYPDFSLVLVVSGWEGIWSVTPSLLGPP